MARKENDFSIDPASEQALVKLITRGEKKRQTPEEIQAMAHRMIRRHGSLSTILESHVLDLMDAEPLSRASARLLTMIPQLSRFLSEEHESAKTRITSAKQAGALLKSRFIGIHYEQIYLLCLDKSGHMLGCPMVQQGTLDETPFYLRNIMETVTRLNAKALVISHNHPGGSPCPSRADLAATERALKLIGVLDACLLDHIIMADGVPISMFETESIPRKMFMSQQVISPLLKNWA